DVEEDREVAALERGRVHGERAHELEVLDVRLRLQLMPVERPQQVGRTRALAQSGQHLVGEAPLEREQRLELVGEEIAHVRASLASASASCWSSATFSLACSSSHTR